VIDTILIGSDFDQSAREISNTAKDTRRDVVCGAWIPRFGAKTALGSLLFLAEVSRPMQRKNAML
jgi:hypothetical protein